MFWKRKTDEEFIECQRKWLVRSRWIAGGMSLIAVCVAAVGLMIFDMLIDWAGQVGMEFSKGMVLGMFLTTVLFWIGGFVAFALVMFFKPRVLRLLVTYHDRLHVMEKQSISTGDLSKTD